MTDFEPGQIVLVRFPFTHLASGKKRPALVLSPAQYVHRQGDIVVMALTSQPQPEKDLLLEHWHSAGLLTPTWLKPVIFTLEASIIERPLGTLAQKDIRRVRQALRLLITADYWPRKERKRLNAIEIVSDT